MKPKLRYSHCDRCGLQICVSEDEFMPSYCDKCASEIADEEANKYDCDPPILC